MSQRSSGFRPGRLCGELVAVLIAAGACSRELCTGLVLPKVDVTKAFDHTRLGMAWEAMRMIEAPSELGAKHDVLADVAAFLCKHAGAVATLSRDNDDIGRIIKYMGLQQEYQSLPAIFALTMDVLVCHRFDEICRCRRYGIDKGTTRIARLSCAERTQTHVRHTR